MASDPRHPMSLTLKEVHHKKILVWADKNLMYTAVAEKVMIGHHTPPGHFVEMLLVKLARFVAKKEFK